MTTLYAGDNQRLKADDPHRPADAFYDDQEQRIAERRRAERQRERLWWFLGSFVFFLTAFLIYGWLRPVA